MQPKLKIVVTSIMGLPEAQLLPPPLLNSSINV